MPVADASRPPSARAGRSNVYVLWLLYGLTSIFAVVLASQATLSARRELALRETPQAGFEPRTAHMFDNALVPLLFLLCLVALGWAIHLALRRVSRLSSVAMHKQSAAAYAALTACSRELDTANKLATVGRLTTGMAHEFGTPLGVVLARAEMILAEAARMEEVHADARAIIEQVKRMTQMCREVLDYARPKSPVREPTELVQLARQLLALLASDARKRNVKLSIGGDPAPLYVLGDTSKLTQVFTNLVMNAIQAMPQGGSVIVRIETPHAQAPSPLGSTTQAYACVRVEDTGSGISDRVLARIFDPFFTTKSPGEGTGLGLPVSERIIAEHGGSMSVQTEEGHGTCFSVYLPVCDPPNANWDRPPLPHDLTQPAQSASSAEGFRQR